MRILKPLLLATSVIAGSSLAARAEVNVVASIKPVHSLVAAVMDGVGTPGIIVDGAGSPHTYALKPSQAQMLEKADVVFWIGHEIEALVGAVGDYDGICSAERCWRCGWTPPSR